MRFFSILLLIVFFSSCQSKEPQKLEVTPSTSEYTVAQKHLAFTPVDKKVLKKIDNWQEYRFLKEFLAQYESISYHEALNNSRELNNLVRSLKDSIKPSFLVSPAFEARINNLHNETLRLYDMSSISSIKHEEVNLQVEKILDAFSALNSKMNTVVKQSDLDEQVSDPKFKRVLQDTLPEPKETSKTLQPSPTQEKMQLTKEERLKKRQLKLQEIQKKQDDEKKKNN